MTPTEYRARAAICREQAREAYADADDPHGDRWTAEALGWEMAAEDAEQPTRYYHGLTHGPLPPTGFAGPEVYLALAPDLADAYADESGVVLVCEYTGPPPLVLDTCEAFLAAWRTSGADTAPGPFHPAKTHAFAEWARAQGHAAVLVPASAFEDEDGYYEVGGRLGDPQLIVLDPMLVRVVGPC